MNPEAVPLSASGLWQSQRRFFVEQGARVWRDGVVPSYVSTNPYLAGFLAEILAAYVADAGGPIDVIELGAGSGKLGFHLVRELSRQLGAGAAFRYVMTDVAPAMIDYWASHPRLQSLTDAGLLDFALFDVEQPGPLGLFVSGDVIGTSAAPRPLALVASYCLDSVAQDVFSVDENGALSECVVTMVGASDKPDEAVLSYELRPCSTNHYGDPVLDELLDGYRRTARGVTFTFPRAALVCLDFFARAWPAGVLALVGDRGFVDPVDSLPLTAIEPTRHGSVSFPVNFGAIGGWFAAHGGVAAHPAHRAQSYSVSCFAVGGRSDSAMAAYRTAVRTRDPDTFFSLTRTMQEHYADLSLGDAIAFLRVSHWDADVFSEMSSHLLERLREPLDVRGRDELMQAIFNVSDNYFPVRADDVLFLLASLAQAAGAYVEALELFDQAIEATGGSADCWLKSALCHEMLGQREKAIDAVYRALVADPDLPHPEELLTRLRGDA